jgi:hypothetical protein
VLDFRFNRSGSRRLLSFPTFVKKGGVFLGFSLSEVWCGFSHGISQKQQVCHFDAFKEPQRGPFCCIGSGLPAKSESN